MEKGIVKERNETIKNMLNLGFDLSMISKVIKVDIEDIRHVIEEIEKSNK